MRRVAFAALVAILGAGCATASIPDRAVATVAAQRLGITTAAGRGDLALYVSRDWQTPQPGVTQAVILVHGLLGRDVLRTDGGRAGRGRRCRPHDRADRPPVPQRSGRDEPSAPRPRCCTGGRRRPAAGARPPGPAPISSFEVIDVILARLADRARFPDLRRVVVAGHSGGGQMVQRYAVVGHGEAALTAAGIAVRYVVANPSSYLYFSAERPRAERGLRAVRRDAAAPRSIAGATD